MESIKNHNDQSPKDLSGTRLLLVCAHPDDECFAFGGMLADAADRGAETTVLCFTDGRAATYRGSATSAEELGRIRREEFAASCAVLGVHNHEILSSTDASSPANYQDARLEYVDFPSTAGLLVERIRRLKPDVVVTFPGDGSLNTHPDHMMTSYLTTSAFHWAGFAKRYPDSGPPFTPQRLFFQSTDFFMPERQPPMPMPWSVKLDVRHVLERKREAFRQHTTQAPLMEKTRGLFDEHGANEFYALVASPEPQACKISTDLFTGIRIRP